MRSVGKWVISVVGAGTVLVLAWHHLPVVPVYPVCGAPSIYTPITDRLDPRFHTSFKHAMAGFVRHGSHGALNLPSFPLLITADYYRDDNINKFLLAASVGAANEMVRAARKPGDVERDMNDFGHACLLMSMIARGEVPPFDDPVLWR